ncbi:uncharacterized protein LOC130723701 isoform X1 [Lotus japonicus]|uniref:uncharacterized protein LOC130723701 isoform X1 n=2 Tax=Lotus japonicus TaxID=34305 RepID=UPI0025839870|nr:uncharacterized protein LOC130723701 isoform X1 [Lotus japonicus]
MSLLFLFLSSVAYGAISVLSLMLRAPLLPPWIFCSSTVVRLGWVHLCVSVFCDSNARGITTAFPVKCLFCKLHYHIYGSELKCFFRLKCGFELSFNICSLHYISKFSPRVRLHYEKRKVLIPEMKTQQTPAIYPPMLASGLFKQGNPVEKVTLNLLLYRDKPAVAIVMKEKKRDASKRYSNFQLRMGRTCEFRLCIG